MLYGCSSLVGRAVVIPVELACYLSSRLPCSDLCCAPHITATPIAVILVKN